MIDKILSKIKHRSSNTNSTKIVDELRCSGRVTVPVSPVTAVVLLLNDTIII